ncbi:unnamed protein product [Cuscuta epithymum]|uniref:Uncharacterized protein n=1 Tax=Cuscuta epithymum TaxID=186058 RepID=A0AAV0C0U7_9ASTE|nr:unnamed protein product [Cuscuta epithymum]CAH9136763.1 unnamed protein product [Cuscuta epithymum]
MYVSSANMKIYSVFIVILLTQALGEALNLDDTDNSATHVNEANTGDLQQNSHSPPTINCGYACSRRCREASRQKMCNRACKTCCQRCNCVPPGTYGNHQLCPCYALLRTHHNRPKCP